MVARRKLQAVFSIALLCFALSLASSASISDTRLLSDSIESRVIGGGDCDDFISGFAIGMGFAGFFGCGWCPIAGIGAKILQVYICTSA
jgi:hypothetical protein